MKKINCNIIKDILPLYVDDILSEDTKELIEEHLKHCENCNSDYKRMAGVVEIPVECDVEPIKKLHKKIKKEKILTALIVSILSIVIVIILGTWALFIGVPLETDKVKITTEIQNPNDTYKDPEFVVHCNMQDGEQMVLKEKNIYEQDENGEDIWVGYEVEIREPLIKIAPLNLSGYTFGYTYREAGAPDEDFDFIIKVKFKDETVTYSMRNEGLFEYYADR